MNRKMKQILTAFLLLTAVFFVTGCSEDQNAYERNDKEGFNVSVKYDANGGTFTTGTSVIVDSYNVSKMSANGEGKAEIALLTPDNAARGNNAFAAANNGYFLAGWYSERIETTDAAGNTVYSYSGKWDFEKDRLKVDPNESHTSSEPVLTLYAAWVPLFEIEFYALDSGELLDTYTFNPTTADEILVPEWDEETGAIEMYNFPGRSGYTFNGAYYDAEGTQAVDTAAVIHPGTVDEASGTAVDNELRLYVDWTEGEWYHIYNVEQFLDNASVGGSYEIYADLDFADVNWPTSLMHGNYSGTIRGNGHTFRNISIEQTNNSKVNSGLFGYLTETAQITDLKLENLTFTIKGGTRVAGANYGLFAGSVSDEAVVSGVSIHNGLLQIDSGCYFGVDDYSIGLVCGYGSVDIDPSGITCQATGENPVNVTIALEDQRVIVEIQ